MTKAVQSLIALSCLGFIIAVFGAVFSFDFIGVDPEGYSRACNNLALIAIALAVCRNKQDAK